MSNSTDSSGDSGGFSITDSQINFANNLASFGTAPGACVCFLVLVAYGIVAYFPNARKYLDRVSFRLLVYALIANVGFGISYAATPAAPGPGCNFGAFCNNLFLTFSTFITTCIAINLQLVLVHHKNGQILEKYYVIGTVLLTFFLNVPTFALHQFGWDEESSTCWYKNGDPNIKLRWIIGTSSFWVALAATIETICSVIILVWMYFYQRTTESLQRVALEAPTTKVTTRATTTKVSSAKGSSTRVNDAARVDEFIRNRPTNITKDPRYRNAILRIALYPIVSLMVNYSTVALDLNTTIVGLNTQEDYRLLVLDLVLYAIRGLAYGLIAATDPSFILAIREMMGKTYNTRQKSSGALSTNLEFARSPLSAGATVIGGPQDLTITKPTREAPSGEKSETQHDVEEKVDSTSNVAQDEEGGTQYDYAEEFRRIEKQL